MVKRLRRCPLTAESAVRFRMGLPKKNDIPGMSFFFWYTPKRNDAATCLPSFVNLRKQILAEELRFTKVKSFRKGMQTETATSAWGYVLLRCTETTRQLVCRRSSICVSKFCRRLPSPALLLSRQLHMGNGNFRMGLHTSSVRETTRQLVCRRSYLRQQILP